jgi:hypothetical protein
MAQGLSPVGGKYQQRRKAERIFFAQHCEFFALFAVPAVTHKQLVM